MITIRQNDKKIKEKISNDYQSLSLYVDKELVSYLIYTYNYDKTIIDQIYTYPKYRRKGYALRLLNKLEIISVYNRIEVELQQSDDSTDSFFSKYFEKENNKFILNRVKTDLHIHLGGVPATLKSNSQEFNISIEQVANYIKESHITHACILYTNYDQLEKLSNLLPNVKLYGLQYYDIGMHNTLFDDQKFDSDKPLWKGIKIHSHRNYSINQIINYSTKGLLSSLFHKLPNNSIILPHFQGSLGSHPLDLMNNMNNYMNHKFIIGHGGTYGFMTYKPTIEKDKFDLNKQNLFYLYLTSLNSVTVAVNLANEMPNVWLDSSIFTVHKNIIFNNCENSGFGSDYPLGMMKDHFLQKQETLYCNSFNKNIHLNSIHTRTIKFLESSIEERMNIFFERNKKC